MDYRKPRNVRVPISVRVTYDYHNAYIFGYSKDISKCGIFIQTDKPVAMGGRVMVQFTLPETSHIIKCEGRVSRVFASDLKEAAGQLNGMGVAFSKISTVDEKEIATFITEHWANDGPTNASVSPPKTKTPPKVSPPELPEQDAIRNALMPYVNGRVAIKETLFVLESLEGDHLVLRNDDQMHTFIWFASIGEILPNKAGIPEIIVKPRQADSDW
ncbi:MAG TPA: PilZ domain-containing protein [Nitrospiria bacterium]|nr:PilZ domain-containing protein [Nitrospiria bacterium]